MVGLFAGDFLWRGGKSPKMLFEGFELEWASPLVKSPFLRLRPTTPAEYFSTVDGIPVPSLSLTMFWFGNFFPEEVDRLAL